jgi:anti-anti-sigma factor
MHFPSKANLTTTAPGVLLLRFPGSSDAQACTELEAVIDRALASQPRLVVVDLSEADSVCTVMIGHLLSLRRGVVAGGGEVRLAGVQPMVRSVLDTCRLDRLFSVHSSPGDAMEGHGEPTI